MANGLYVHSEIGPLKKVLLHRPGKELLNLKRMYLEQTEATAPAGPGQTAYLTVNSPLPASSWPASCCASRCATAPAWCVSGRSGRFRSASRGKGRNDGPDPEVLLRAARHHRHAMTM